MWQVGQPSKRKQNNNYFRSEYISQNVLPVWSRITGKRPFTLELLWGEKKRVKNAHTKKVNSSLSLEKKCRNVSQKLNKCGHRLKQLQSVYADLSAICKMEGAGGERRDPGGDGAQILVTVADSSLPSISSVFVIPC